MQTIEQLLPSRCDRTDWSPGPWDAEPDYRQWRDPATGLPCLVVRNPHGAWCGYVGVSAGHPWYEQPFTNIDDETQVHGGLTYSDHCAEEICHVVEAGEDDHVWWLGFDTFHYCDMSPGMQAQERRLGLPDFPQFYGAPVMTYKNMGYVTAECESLARQALERAKT